MIHVGIADAELVAALGRLRDRLGEAGMRPAQAEIGEHLTESTKQRFETSTAPDGSRWAPKARSTLERLLAGTKGGVGKKGRITARGSAAMMRAPPSSASKPRPPKRRALTPSQLANAGLSARIRPLASNQHSGVARRSKAARSVGMGCSIAP